MKRIAVIHLVRQANGLPAFRAFLDSYRRHPAGIAHQLVLLCKGFTDEGQFQLDPVEAHARQRVALQQQFDRGEDRQR